MYIIFQWLYFRDDDNCIEQSPPAIPYQSCLKNDIFSICDTPVNYNFINIWELNPLKLNIINSTSDGIKQKIWIWAVYLREV